MEPGIYEGISREEYDSIEALNQSTIKVAWEKSLYHAHYQNLHEKDPTDAMIMGQALHTSILEPHLFNDRYATMPVNEKGDRLNKRTKVGADAWSAYESEHGTKIPLKPAAIEDIRLATAHIRSHPAASSMLDAALSKEVAIVWTHPEYGFKCKALIDLITLYEGWTWIVDVKSTTDASPAGFSRTVANYSYMIQAAWNIDGLNQVAPAERRFGFIAFEKEAPYGTAVYEIDPLSLYEGRYRCDKIAAKWARALKTGWFEGYSNVPVMTDSKQWAMTHEKEIGEG
jgi:exodeoxyribonuclease VIII